MHEILTPDQVANWLKLINGKAAIRLSKNKIIPGGFKLGKFFRFRRSEIEKYIEEASKGNEPKSIVYSESAFYKKKMQKVGRNVR